jgi:hypothetical protein
MTNRPDLLDDFLAFLDEASEEHRAREAAYREWLGRALPVIADELTETLLPPEMRAAGMRFEWEAAE